MIDEEKPSAIQGAREWWGRTRLDFKIFVWLALLAAIVAPLGWFVVRPIYYDWSQARTLRVARFALDRGDADEFRSAIRKFSGSNGGSAQDWAAAAELLDRVESKDAQKLWREAARRAPENAAYRISLLSAALRAGDLAAAGAAIESADQAMRARREFPALLARYSLQIGDLQTAVAEFERAVAADPNPRLFLEYGRLLSTSDRPDRREKGYKLLEKASEDPSVRLEALRILFLRDLQAEWDYSAQKRLDAIRATPGATFEDAMLVLDLDVAHGRLDPAHLKLLIGEAADDPRRVEALGGWLLAHGAAAETRELLDAVGPSAPGAVALPMLELRLACATGDWPAAERIAREKLRDPAAADALQAALAPAADDDTLVDWRSPLDRAENDPVALDLLRTYYAATGQAGNEMPVIQALIDRTPGDSALWARLLDLCRITRDTAMLRRFTFEFAKAAGNPPELAGEVLTLDLLTDRVAPDEALKRARELRSSSVASPAAANAEAFALARLGRGREALAIYRQFPDRAWQDPARSVLVGYALAQAGEHAAAEARFAEAERSSKGLLVEYEVLIRRTRDQMAGPAIPVP